MNLTTEAEVATETFKLSPAKFAELRRQHKWSHVRVSRFDVRYTDAQVEAIVELLTQRAEKSAPSAPRSMPGQTSRSAQKRSA